MDISLDHAEMLMWPFFTDVAEHYGYDGELYSLDLTNSADAIFAVEKWILPEVSDWSKVGMELRREACRFCLINGLSFSGYWLPGIDSKARIEGYMEIYTSDVMAFQKLLWSRIFEEPFTPTSLQKFRIRIDFEFRRFPDNPEVWGAPKYAD